MKDKPKSFAKAAVSTLTDQANYIKELEEKVSHLESLLKNSEVPSVGRPKKQKPKELEICETEIARIHQKVVLNNIPMDRDELKMYETLVKCWVQIKSIDKKPTKEIEESEFKGKSDKELLKMIESIGSK